MLCAVCCVCCVSLPQEAIQRALEENPELAAQLDPDFINKVCVLTMNVLEHFGNA